MFKGGNMDNPRNESPRRRFIDVPVNELTDAVIEMCAQLRISNSGAGDYNLIALLIEYQSDIKNKLLEMNKAFDQ